ncbi:ferredoxin domain-containing protein [Natranaerobius trueperi]|uniref:Ferredoxin n=1 Tax=Natranaerobius trueperi TaxID=759412 RepID=A0A226BWV9_9FIRM|nr:DUF2148 domain-containing protein [Natranaerobius trueperi]OWZ83503.1 ferredoxin [Natranaerobius trueperi]
MLTEGRELEERAVERASELITAAARTAPKGKGVDNLVTAVATGETIDKLRNRMYEISEKEGVAFFKRDADNLEHTSCIVLIGTKIQQLGIHPCGYCGFKNCTENKENEGVCAFNSGDLGIALGSAVSKAADLRIDNRIMFSAGKAAIDLNLLGDEVKLAYGIPLFIGGKNIYFDR